MTGSPKASQHLRRRAFSLREATSEGVRTWLCSYRRCSVSTEEACNTVRAPYADATANVHWLSNPLRNMRTQAQAEDSVTAATQCHLDSGQGGHAICSKFAVPSFPKRPCIYMVYAWPVRPSGKLTWQLMLAHVQRISCMTLRTKSMVCVG